MRAQLSVFLVFPVGDLHVTYPNPDSVTLNEKLLDDVSYRNIAKPGENKAAFFWSQIGQYPDKYLEASQELVKETIYDADYATGTAFAISWEGIFLTNAHVVADPDPRALLGTRDNAYFCLSKPILAETNRLEVELGALPR